MSSGISQRERILLVDWIDYTKAYLRSRAAGPGAWFMMHGRSRELVLANRSTFE